MVVRHFHFTKTFIILSNLFFSGYSGTLYAATATTTFQVTATVSGTCSLNAATLAFGSYDPTSGTPVDTTSSINVTCTNGMGYTLGLNGGSTAGDVANRQMNGASAQLNYGLFTDASHTNNWTDIGGANVASGTGNGAAQAYTVYGRIPTGQYVNAGAYSDTITVTVDF